MDTITASSVEDRFVTVGDLSIRYVEAGDGLPLILLHGASLGSSADVFLRNLGPLASAGFRPIAFDQPGFGLSDNPTDFSVGYRKKSIMGFIDALGLEKAVLVGHSQAGNMAVANAFENPDRISHVVILGTGSLLPPLPGGAPKKKAPVEGREGTPQEPSIGETRKLLEATLFHHELITDDELALRQSRSIGKNFAAFVERGKVSGGGGKAGTPLWQQIATSPVPIRLIFGREDRANAYERAMLLKETYPDIDLHIMDGCKHLVPWDAADEYVRLTVDFLNS
ncbi:MAG: pimeloyl-ACP methyl ester carboxylesterase [Alphaproteobacteria bacterium]|jgi:pimeloyl-ACP methyl ester carboxylesterase